MRGALLTLSLAALFAGCSQPPQVRETLPQEIVEMDGIRATMQTDKLRYSRDEYIQVWLRLTNMTSQPITIQSQRTEPVYISLYRDTPLGWQAIGELPPSSQSDYGWVLPPGGQRVFSLPVRVGPEFPPNQYVRLVAHVSGRPSIQPGVNVWIIPSDQAFPVDTMRDTPGR